MRKRTINFLNSLIMVPNFFFLRFKYSLKETYFSSTDSKKDLKNNNWLQKV